MLQTLAAILTRNWRNIRIAPAEWNFQLCFVAWSFHRVVGAATGKASIANATSRTVFMAPRDPALYYYPGSGWQNMLFDVGYEFETPIPLITPEGVKPFPPTGYRTLDARTDFFYGVTGITPAMAMRLPGIGSTYLWTMVDAKEGALRRRQDLQGDTAEGHPTGKLLVVHALRQHVALNARHTTALPARGQPKLSITRRGSERGMVRRRSTSARRSRRTSNGQLDSDHAR
jgi:hypothetical protein